MIEHETLLVTLVKLVSRIPVPPPSAKRGRGRPRTYPDRLFLQALVMMIVRHLHTVHALLSVLAQPTMEMHTLRGLLTVAGRFPARRTWERRLQSIPATLPAQIGCLGRALVSLVQPWAGCGRAAAIDSTVLRAHGGVWHKKDREARTVPHTSIDTEAHWTKSGWHGWVYGWKLHLVTTVAGVWIPLAADLTAANVADHVQALTLLPELPAEVRSVLGDQHDHDPALDAACTQAGQTVVATHRGP
jgi:Transposase DDE domain